ncbi:MAG: hypothetical protein OXC14_08870 [Rhodospirillaceae bacterium]|nr:hypothetical protein [Rhodospirillaceae bacterium]
MDTELFMVGIALAALMIGLFAWLRTDIAGLRADMDKRLDDLDSRLRAVEHGQAKLEGLLEGLREAIAGRKDAA